jgi:probable aminopeptidase NPEPL1
VIATGKKHAAVLSNDEDTERAAVSAGKATGDLLFPIMYLPRVHGLKINHTRTP